MKSFVAALATLALAFGSVILSPGVSAEPDGDRLFAQAAAAQQPGAKKKPTGRLPNNYAKLGLSETQKTAIYEAQAKYKDQIEALEKQIADLEAKRNAEVEGTLTPEQKEKLKELVSPKTK